MGVWYGRCRGREERERERKKRRRKKEQLTSQEEQQTLYNNTQIKLTTSRFPISLIYTPFFFAELRVWSWVGEILILTAS